MGRQRHCTGHRAGPAAYLVLLTQQAAGVPTRLKDRQGRGGLTPAGEAGETFPAKTRPACQEGRLRGRKSKAKG